MMNWRRAYHEGQATYVRQWTEWRRTSPDHVVRLASRQRIWRVGDMTDDSIREIAREVAEHDIERAINKHNETADESKRRAGVAI